jgi:RNA-directed DNA polymerase
MKKTKSYDISKQLFVRAYKRVKANAGAAGVDRQSLKDFEKNLKDNLYKLWNRMSSGSYFPPDVLAVSIPKKTGGVRILGIPTVADRIAQMVVKLEFEPKVEPYFLEDSYGYRPNKSALDAIGITRQRCWKYDWVLEFDIKGLFDNIPHELLMKAVRKHTDNKWMLLYIERWLKAGIQQANGNVIKRELGTPQGGVISPILSNLFMHYVFDKWMDRKHKAIPWCRYADDGLAHCKTEQEAKRLLSELKIRLAECGLEMHPEKTKIVYCKDALRKRRSPNTSFDFLGYTFIGRACRRKGSNRIFIGFNPGASKGAQKSMRAKTKTKKWYRRSDLSLNEIAKQSNPVIRGWLNYYGRYHKSEMYKVLRHFNKTLVNWAMRKYKSLRGRKTKASQFLQRIYEREPHLFAHWNIGMVGSFA